MAPRGEQGCQTNLYLDTESDRNPGNLWTKIKMKVGGEKVGEHGESVQFPRRLHVFGHARQNRESKIKESARIL